MNPEQIDWEIWRGSDTRHQEDCTSLKNIADEEFMGQGYVIRNIRYTVLCQTGGPAIFNLFGWLTTLQGQKITDLDVATPSPQCSFFFNYLFVMCMGALLVC